MESWTTSTEVSEPLVIKSNDVHLGETPYVGLFKVISQGEEGATIAEVANFLQEVVQIPLSFSVNAQNGSSQTIDTCVQDCFKKVSPIVIALAA